MTDWFRVDVGFRSHPKVVILRSALKCSQMEALGIVASLWALAAEHATDGDLSDLPTDFVREWFPGVKGNVVAALQQAGYLDGFTVHDWYDHNGDHLATLEVRRMRDRERKRQEREAARTVLALSAGRPQDTARTAPDNPQDVHGVRNVTERNRTGQTPLTPQGGVVGGPSPLEQALLDVFGDPGTASEVRRWAKAHDELAAAGATPEDVRARAAEYRRRWPDASCTPTALASNWSALVPGARPANVFVPDVL